MSTYKAVIERKQCISDISYHLPVLVQPPRCLGYAGQTWPCNGQTVAGSHPAKWREALTHSSSLLGGLDQQSSMDFCPCLHHPTVFLPHSAATLAYEEPTDTSLQPTRRKQGDQMKGWFCASHTNFVSAYQTCVKLFPCC